MATLELPAIKAALNAFQIADTRPLSATGIDAAHELMPMIYSIATLMEMGHRPAVGGGEAACANANPALIAQAFDGIARLAALAMFNVENL